MLHMDSDGLDGPDAHSMDFSPPLVDNEGNNSEAPEASLVQSSANLALDVKQPLDYFRSLPLR